METDKQNLRLSRRQLLRICCYGGLALSGGVGFAQAKKLEILRGEALIAGLSPQLDGLRVGVMADFHAGGWGNQGIIEAAVESMAALNPELILLLGDYVDGARSHEPENISNADFLWPLLARLQPRLGVFAVLGNHDHWIDADGVAARLAKAGVTILRNCNVRLEDNLVLAGVDDYWEGPALLRTALKGVEQPSLLLSHHPDLAAQLAVDSPVQLVLAGHTHGGQIRIPFVKQTPWVPCMPRYRDILQGCAVPRLRAARLFLSARVLAIFFCPCG